LFPFWEDKRILSKETANRNLWLKDEADAEEAKSAAEVAAFEVGERIEVADKDEEQKRKR